MEKKLKVLTISDSPLSTSGVGIQTRNFIEGLLKSGKFQVESFAGAIQHQDYKPIKTKEWGDDWLIFPVKGFGTQEQVRSFVMSRKPDMLWFMTDPRFFDWLWEIASEIREKIPMIYYNVWDNFPPPFFNKPFWDNNDLLVSMSQITHEMNGIVSPDVDRVFLPLAVDTNVFQKRDKESAFKLRQQALKEKTDKFIFLWVNRNARRKQPGTLIYWFKEFLEEVGQDKACLVMHTNPKDQFGQDLEAVIHAAGLTEGEVLFSPAKLPPQDLSLLYTMADCVVNVADAEGVGLGTIESLACETPIIATKTGGMQEQFAGKDGKVGYWLEPKAKSVVGSQGIPYIYEDRVTKEDFLKACHKMYNLTQQKREMLGKAGREVVLDRYNLETFQDKWVEILEDSHDKYGSWETRKGFCPFSVQTF